MHQLPERTLPLKYFLKFAFLLKNNLYLQDKGVQKAIICFFLSLIFKESCENPITNRVATQTQGVMVEQKPAQSKTAMILISFFLGGLGIHRLMMGYSNWWLMLITGGGCGIWALVDFISIITGSMKMQDGRDLI